MTSNLPKTFHENNLDSNDSNDSQDDCDSEDFENIEDENSKEKNNLSSISTIYDVFVAGGLSEVFPTLNNALRIALTLPVSSASTERKFSKLKIVKNRLRTTMTQERLESLMMVYCEQDIECDTNTIINKFASRGNLINEFNA